MARATPRPKAESGGRVLRLPSVVHEVRRANGGRLRLRRRFGASVSLLAVRAELLRVDGVEEVRINRRAASVVVVYLGPRTVRQEILRAVARLDDARLAAPPTDAGAIDPSDADEATATALLSAAVVAASVPFLPDPLRRMLVLASIGSTVFKGLKALVERGISVEVLDATAVAVPALRGAAGTAATTNLLLQVAAYVEHRASQRSDDLVRGLLRSEPETIRVERDGIELEIPYREVRVGERVVVMPGEVVAVDGTVIDGGGTIDPAAITGESIPIPHHVDDRIKSGVALLDGRLVVAAEQVGDATTVARIRAFMERALAERSTFQRVADRMADRRVWVTFGTAAGVYALTGNLARLESVSLVDFSCTTKLGTAVGVKSALYRAGKLGVLVKGGDALDALAKVDTVVFDKTGTLSAGRLRVTDVASFRSDWDEDRLLTLAASLAEHTTHPVAASVVDLVQQRGLGHIGHEEVSFMVGHGLTSRVEGAEVALGSRHFLVDHRHVDLSPHRDRLDAMTGAGDTLLYLAHDGEILGAIGLRDQNRPEAGALIQRLRTLGVQRVLMVTGDVRSHAARIADELGLDGVYAEREPEDKASIVHQLRDDGSKVAFVGDGVNDGPALMAADVGISMPAAADIARATADVVLLDDDLDGVATAVSLAQETMQRIHRNLNAAAASNTVVLALAAMGRLSPLTASLLHNGTTLAVLAASWRARS